MYVSLKLIKKKTVKCTGQKWLLTLPFYGRYKNKMFLCESAAQQLSFHLTCHTWWFHLHT